MKEVIYKYYLVVIIYTVADFLFGSGYTAFIVSKNISSENLGMIFLIWSIFSFILEIPSGSIADKYGRKKILALGLFIWSVGLFSFSYSSNQMTFIGSFLFIALGVALISGTPQAWYISSLEQFDDESKRVLPKAQSVSLLFSVVSGLLFAVVVLNTSSEIPYRLAALLSFVLSMIVMLCYKENYSENEPTKGNISVIKIISAAFMQVKKNRILKWYIIKLLFLSIALQLFILTWQLYATQKFGLDDYLLGPLLTIYTLTLSFAYFLAAKLATRIKDTIKISVFGAMILIIGTGMLTFSQNIVTFSIASIFLELGIGLEGGASMMWIQDHIKDEIRTTTLSIFSIVSTIAAMIASLCISSMVELIWQVSFVCALLGFFVILKIFLIMRKRLTV
ncbi:MFS transporter [Listeria innocua]|uniref:MFS transporter n=1 Tax=Listeria innocua TaxID=1642 RepID=UPI00162A30DB|nr:MFS transporter [Listeria innocua]MBC1925435.1 MFS transporter [Listeria innocua]